MTKKCLKKVYSTTAFYLINNESKHKIDDLKSPSVNKTLPSDSFQVVSSLMRF
jgi:hypothetical protein